MDLALNNIQTLICHKTLTTNQSKHFGGKGSSLSILRPAKKTDTYLVR